MKVLRLKKLDCAKRQLLTALKLYFWHGDPVSIHTLTCAVYNVLRDLTKARDAKPMHAKQIYVKLPGKFSLNDLNEAENFFKHADKDPDREIEFPPKLTEPLLSDACEQYRILSNELVPEFDAYQIWFMSQKPELFDIPKDMAVFAAECEQLFKIDDRAEFLTRFEKWVRLRLTGVEHGEPFLFQ